ncbi:MAG: hypothetical protein LBM99_02265 [Bacillales bacterium]|jgi:hypothetical protein|nr:hypothetical protein [Bacillales bacterium]
MRKIVLSVAMLTIILFGLVSCSGENNVSEVKVVANDSKGYSVDDLIVQINKQKAIPERKLMNYGYSGTDLEYVHKIGTINGAFVGYFTDAMYYDGIGVSNLTYTKSEAKENALNESITNIEMQTNEVRGKIEVDIAKIVHLGFEYAHTWTSGSEKTIGKSYSEMIENASSYSYGLSSERGAGFFAIAAFTRYSVYQTTKYDLKTNAISETKITFTQDVNEPRLNIYLVKASDETGFDGVLDDINPGLQSIKTLTSEEIQQCKDFSKTKIKSTYTFVHGNEMLQNDIWFSDSWGPYEKLDTISNILVETDEIVKLDLYKLYFTKFAIRLNYSFHSENTNNVRIQIKIVNKTTGLQVGETSEHVPNGRYDVTLSFNDFKDGDVFIVEVRQRKVGGWGTGGIRYYANREYIVTFS